MVCTEIARGMLLPVFYIKMNTFKSRGWMNKLRTLTPERTISLSLIPLISNKINNIRIILSETFNIYLRKK